MLVLLRLFFSVLFCFLTEFQGWRIYTKRHWSFVYKGLELTNSMSYCSLYALTRILHSEVRDSKKKIVEYLSRGHYLKQRSLKSGHGDSHTILVYYQIM